RLLRAYGKIRGNMRNGLAVVTMDRGACGGCFAIIPPQRQAEIRQRRKLIVCENCGRILVDYAFLGLEAPSREVEAAKSKPAPKPKAAAAKQAAATPPAQTPSKTVPKKPESTSPMMENFEDQMPTLEEEKATSTEQPSL